MACMDQVRGVMHSQAAPSSLLCAGRVGEAVFKVLLPRVVRVKAWSQYASTLQHSVVLPLTHPPTHTLWEGLVGLCLSRAHGV